MTLGTVHFDLGGGATCGSEGDLTTDREGEVTCGDCDSILVRNAEEDREYFDAILELERKQLGYPDTEDELLRFERRQLDG